MRLPRLGILLLAALTSVMSAQQKTAEVKTATVSCTFGDGRQISARFVRAPVSKGSFVNGSLYPPASSPMLLFTQAEVSVGGTAIPIGAYSMFVIPDKKTWTLVVNKNVTAGSPYDEHQDLVRVPGQIGHLGEPAKRFQIAFGHIAPKQCNMRINYDRTGTWFEFKEK